MGKPGFPIPLPVGRQALPTGRVWEGAALPRTNIFILALCASCMGPDVNTGKPGFPPLLFTGNASRSQQRLGHGETGFPQPPP